jgi:hypothetical protein
MSGLQTPGHACAPTSFVKVYKLQDDSKGQTPMDAAGVVANVVTSLVASTKSARRSAITGLSAC